VEAGSYRLVGQDLVAEVAGLSRPRAGVSTGAIVTGLTATAPGAAVAVAGTARAPVVSRCVIGAGTDSRLLVTVPGPRQLVRGPVEQPLYVGPQLLPFLALGLGELGQGVRAAHAGEIGVV